MGPDISRPLVVFDLFGVLIDAAPVVRSAINQTRTQLGFRAVTIDEVRRAFGHGAERLVAALSNETPRNAAQIGKDDLAALGNLLATTGNLIKTAVLEQPEPFAGAHDFVSAWADAADLAVLTNAPEDFAHTVLGNSGLLPFFGRRILGDAGKPDTARARKFLRELALCQREVALMLGDMQPDFEFARAISCGPTPLASVYARWGYGVPPFEPEPTWSASSFEQFSDLLTALTGLSPALAGSTTRSSRSDA